MKTFFFMGRNPRNRSGLSWKIWKVQRTGRSVVVRWGPAIVRRRKPVFAHTPQERERRFTTVEAAQRFEESRIAEKVRTGYERRTRWR